MKLWETEMFVLRTVARSLLHPDKSILFLLSTWIFAELQCEMLVRFLYSLSSSQGLVIQARYSVIHPFYLGKAAATIYHTRIYDLCIGKDCLSLLQYFKVLVVFSWYVSDWYDDIPVSTFKLNVFIFSSFKQDCTT